MLAEETTCSPPAASIFHRQLEVWYLSKRIFNLFSEVTMQQLELECLLSIFDMQIDELVCPETIMGMNFHIQLIHTVLVKAGVTNKSSFRSFFLILILDVSLMLSLIPIPSNL